MFSYIRFPCLPLPAAPFRCPFLLLLFHFYPVLPLLPSPAPPPASPSSVPALLQSSWVLLRLLLRPLLLLFFYPLSVTVTPASRYASSLNRPPERTNERTFYSLSRASFVALWSKRKKMLLMLDGCASHLYISWKQRFARSRTCKWWILLPEKECKKMLGVPSLCAIIWYNLNTITKEVLL